MEQTPNHKFNIFTNPSANYPTESIPGNWQKLVTDNFTKLDSLLKGIADSIKSHTHTVIDTIAIKALTVTGTLKLGVGDKAYINAESGMAHLNRIYSPEICGETYNGPIAVRGEISYMGLSKTTTTGAALGVTSGDSQYIRQRSSSSRRHKHDLSYNIDSDLDPHRLLSLKLAQYVYNDDYLDREDERYRKTVVGLIAEDVAELYPIAADHNGAGEVENWQERYIVPPMLALVQELYQRVEELEQRGVS